MTNETARMTNKIIDTLIACDEIIKENKPCRVININGTVYFGLSAEDSVALAHREKSNLIAQLDVAVANLNEEVKAYIEANK